jgi:hypothetical protein
MLKFNTLFKELPTVFFPTRKNNNIRNEISDIYRKGFPKTVH